MSSYGADDLSNFLNNIIPSSLTVTPWQVQLAKLIYQDTADERLKSISGAQGWNVVFIDNLKKLSIDPLLSGADRYVYMNTNGNSTDAIDDSFFDHVDEVHDSESSLNKILLVAGFVAAAVIVVQFAPVIGSFIKKDNH